MIALKINKFFIGLFVFGIVFVIAQLTNSEPEHRLVTQNINAPKKVEAILRKACYDCHSNETNLKWFDKIAPVTWLVKADVEKGRMALNFSEWDKLDAPTQKAKLFYAVNKIISGEMPLNNYKIMHPEAQLTPDDITILKDYLSSITSNPAKRKTITKNKNNTQLIVNNVQPTLNGIEYIDGYRDWKAMSTTFRFDNNSMRVIYANDIAAKAIEEGKTNTWPNGSIFAKVAWKQEADSTGVIQSGDFHQVEFMIKDTNKYKDTEGWGWARWRGKDLKPYGNDALFTNECIRCHNPAKNTDYVFTKPLKINIR